MVWMNRTILWRTIRRRRQEMNEVRSLFSCAAVGVGKKRKKVEESNDVDKSKDSKKKKKKMKKNHTCDKSDESEAVKMVKDDESEVVKMVEGESVQGMSKKQKKKAREKMHMKKKKEREAAKLATKIILKLKSSGRYEKSWFLQNKPMLHDLVVSLYWGPAWLNDLLQWFIHGCWPQKSGRDKNNNSFIRKFRVRRFQEQLVNDMKSFWPEPQSHFLNDEWEKHCRATNMTPEEFFATAMDICRAIFDIGIDLPHGILMHAHEALSLVEDNLGKAQLSAIKNKPNEDILSINELKIYIDRNSYAIGSRQNKLSYLGDLKDGDEVVILAEECVRS